MKKQLHTILLLLLAFSSHSQTWQWGKRGGSTDNLSNTGGDRIEEVIDIVTDSQKNIYVLSPVGQTLLNIDGNPKTNYGDSSSKTDYALSSFSCDGTYRWSKIIGGGGRKSYYYSNRQSGQCLRCWSLHYLLITILCPY